MEFVAVDLTLGFEIAGDDGVVEAGVAVAVWVFDLAAVAGVVEEVAGVGFGDEPVHCGEDVLAVGVEGAVWVGALVVSHDHLGFGVVGVAFVGEELRHVRDVLVAATESVLRADVVDSYE